jgi:putative oxidoreductase
MNTADPVPPHQAQPGATVVLDAGSWIQAAGRVLLSLLFIWHGMVQLLHPAATALYFASVHVPLPQLAVWVSIPLHLLGGLALLVGVRTRLVAALLALLTLGTALGVHLVAGAGDEAKLLDFYKNLAIAGGLLYVVACGAGRISIDRDGHW